MQNIRDVLNRRNDLSTFVVHLTKGVGTAPSDNLVSIIQTRTLEARSAMGWAKEQDDSNDQTKQSQRVVSFSETPLEHIYSLVADILGRQVNLKSYGLAFTKMAARKIGVNPVWYVDRTAGAPHGWQVSNAVNQVRDAAIATGNFHETPAAKLLPFFEVMGTWPTSQNEFWWEREWRHRGNLTFSLDQVSLWLCPEGEIQAITQLIQSQTPPPQKMPRCTDPKWGLEQIVAHLVDETEVTPFDPH